MEAHAAQDREFRQMEDAIDHPEKDDDLVAIFLLQPESKACRAFSCQQRTTQTGTSLSLIG